MERQKYRFKGLRRETLGLLFYFTVTIFFLSIVAFNQRSHSDPWVLDGILLPTLIYVFIFFVVQTFVESNKKIAVVTSSFVAVLNLIPGFKYQLFYNPYDSTFHFRFTTILSRIGNVAGAYAFGDPGPLEYYVGDPGMHVFMSSLSLVTGIPINDIFRFIIPATFGITPLAVYFLTKNVLSPRVQKYAIVASALTVDYIYIVTGTHLSIVLYILFFAIFLRFWLTGEHKTENVMIFLVLGFALVISHAVTPIFVALLLIGLPVGLRIAHALWPTRFPKFSPTLQYSFLILTYIVILMTYWAYLASADLVFFSNYIKSALSLTEFMTQPAIPPRFFQVPLSAELTIFFVTNIQYLIVGVLSLLGIFLFFRNSGRKKSEGKIQGIYANLLIFIGIIVMYIVFITVTGHAPLAYTRFMSYMLPFLVLFVGLALMLFDSFLSKISPSIKTRKLVFAFLLFLLLSLSLIQFFPCQSLVPRASVLGRSFSEDDYLVDFQLVNTVYQKDMVSFVEAHSSKAKIVSDISTGWQVYGFSNGTLYLRYIPIWERSVKSSLLELNQSVKVSWDLFLLHTSKAGPFQEHAEYRTEQRIENIRTQAGNLVYDNGESFVIGNVGAPIPLP